MNVTEANKVAQRTLKSNPMAAAVLVEFVMQATGLTKYLRVWRDGRVEVLDLTELEEGEVE